MSHVCQPEAARASNEQLLEPYRQVRRATEALCKPLVVEDYVVQSMPDVSPAKWHLAHTTWFFETFALGPNVPAYRPFDQHFSYLFNSYYVTVGDRHCRQNRGLLSRPTVAEIYEFREHVDQHMAEWLARKPLPDDVQSVVELGLHHEQQHQELLITDIKHVFWVNPLRPAYQPRKLPPRQDIPPMKWKSFPGGLADIGHDGAGFSFDNELPRHRVFIQPFALGSRLVTNGEYKRFIEDEGYRRPELWLSAGWTTAEQEQWTAPLYWILQDGAWWQHTLSGLRAVEDDEPLCHVSYFEADAFARWAGARLPTEFEWEVAAQDVDLAGSFVESGSFHPLPAPPGSADDASDQHLLQMFGDAWQWTASHYSPYPGFQPTAGALGEYNGKFMCGQFVLRGGSCATPASHIRRSYRNFFPPEARWQFSGIRLARDA